MNRTRRGRAGGAIGRQGARLQAKQGLQLCDFVRFFSLGEMVLLTSNAFTIGKQIAVLLGTSYLSTFLFVSSVPMHLQEVR